MDKVRSRTRPLVLVGVARREQARCCTQLRSSDKHRSFSCMIHPFVPSDEAPVSWACDGNYRIVSLDHKLPAFDPLRMVKTILLSPISVKRFNHIVGKHGYHIRLSVFIAFGLRLVIFAGPASLGRVLSPIATILSIPCMTVFASGMRVDFVKIVAHTFDFWFIQLANLIWAITLSAVLLDLRATLVLVYSAYFTMLLFQETNLRHSTFGTLLSFGELTFCLLLMAWLSLGLVDDAHHHVLLVARKSTLSTKDVLVNALGTMTMLSLRHTYRRYMHAVHQKNNPGAPIQVQGYRCKIALSAVGPRVRSVTPYQNGNSIQETRSAQRHNKPKAISVRSTTKLLQMYLVTKYADIDPRKTIWPRIGALTYVATWKSVVLYSCGIIGAGFAALSLFLPSKSSGTAVIAVFGLTTSTLFSGVHLCCSQRQLLTSIVTSFNYLFLMFQIFAIGVCLLDMLSWHWVSVCGVISSWVLVHTILTTDALTPIMKFRLRFKYWLVIGGIIMFWLIHAGLLLDMLVLGNFNLQDRVFLDFVVFDRRSQFRVVPFLLSRVVTVLVWAARYVVTALTGNSSALVLLRGTVEFDYENWKKEMHSKRISPRTG